MNKMNLMNTIFVYGLAANAYAFPIIGINAQATGKPMDNVNISKLSQAEEGVQIVGDSELPNIKLPERIKFALKSQKQLGYVPRKSYAAVQLLTMQRHHFQTPSDIKFFNSNELTDTHLKKSLSQIKLGFDYRPLSFVPDKDILGFAPAMTFQPTGWTGIVQFFNYSTIGTCKYVKSSVSLNGSSIQLSKQQISLYINKKPAQVMNEGTKDDGFAYLLHWYDNQYFHELTCASEAFNEEKAKRMVSLADLIDKE